MSATPFFLQDKKMLRRFGQRAVRFFREGFCVRATWALEQSTRGTVHVIASRSYTMARCGLNTRARPTPVRLVRSRYITCRRCLTVVLLDLGRRGLIATRSRAATP